MEHNYEQFYDILKIENLIKTDLLNLYLWS